MKKLIVAMIILLAVVAAGVIVFVLRPVASPPVVQQEQQTAKPPSHIDAILANMSLRDKVASLFMLHAPGIDAATLQQYVESHGLSGLILMGDNIPTSNDALLSQNKMLYGKDAKLPRLVATDQEGGTVKRLTGDDFNSALTLKTLPVSATAQAFDARSRMVQAAGITLNFGIIADVTNDPSSFIYDRVLGTTPEAAAERVAAAVEASKGKTLSTIKHFPGHGETSADSHTSIPTTGISYAQWQQRDEPPFAAGIKAGADVVMTGHLRYEAVDSVPASLSQKWHEILRKDLAFHGVVITDDMIMLQNSGDAAYGDPVQNAVLALQAGNDLLLYVLDNQGDLVSKIDPNQLIDGVTSAVNEGKISTQIIDTSARRVLELRGKSAALVKK